VNKHVLGVSYTRAEVIEMYGEQFVTPFPPRPSKPCVEDAAQFDENHQQTYATIAAKIQELNQDPIQVWACGSRVKGYWWTPEEDPRKRGSDWDIWTNAKTLPDKQEISKDLPGVRVDWTFGANPPAKAVRVF
jgi:hypothetical protein